MDIILDNVFIAVELIVAALVETRIAAGISFGTILNYAARALGESFFDADIYDVDNRGGVLYLPWGGSRPGAGRWGGWRGKGWGWGVGCGISI